MYFVNNVVPIGDGNNIDEADSGNQNESSMHGGRIMMNSIHSQHENQVENGPNQQGQSDQQSSGGNEAQGQIGNGIERKQNGEECMASIELCLIQAILKFIDKKIKENFKKGFATKWDGF